MITMPSNEQNPETAADTQDAETVASVKLDDVTGGWWGPGPYAVPYGGGWGPYGNPYGPPSPRYAAAYERRAAWYAANAPRFAPWWGY